jgi:hypothetical protein
MKKNRVGAEIVKLPQQQAGADGIEFIREPELNRRLGISKGTNRNWRLAGDLPYIKSRSGRGLIFHWPSVVASMLCLQRNGQ